MLSVGLSDNVQSDRVPPVFTNLLTTVTLVGNYVIRGCFSRLISATHDGDCVETLRGSSSPFDSHQTFSEELKNLQIIGLKGV